MTGLKKLPGSIYCRLNFRRWNKKELVFLILLLGSLLFVFNKLNISPNRYTLHPDDHDVYVFSKTLLESGHTWYQSPYNEIYDTNSFRPGLNDFQTNPSRGRKIYGSYSPGVYCVVALGHLAGYRGPFVIVSLLGLAGILFLYLFVKELYGFKAAVISAILLGFSSVYVYWSNMLFSNIPAVSFLLGGLLFTARAITREKRIYYFLSTAFLVISFWIRYEYVLLAAIVWLVCIVAYRRKLNKRYVLESILLLLVIGLVLMGINMVTSGSIYGIQRAKGFGSHVKRFTLEYSTTMLKSHVFQAIASNARMQIFDLAPVMVLLGLLGMVFCARSNRDGFLLALFLIALLVFLYFGRNPGYWGYGTSWLGSSYTRYFLPIFVVLSVLAGVFTSRYLALNLNQVTSIAMVALILASSVLISIHLLTYRPFGINHTDQYCGYRKSFNNYLGSQSDDLVAVDLTRKGFFRSMIISRTVFLPKSIPLEDRANRTASIIRDLVYEGKQVLLIDLPDSSIFELESLQADLSPLVLVELPPPVKFETGVETPKLYEVVAPESLGDSREVERISRGFHNRFNTPLVALSRAVV